MSNILRTGETTFWLGMEDMDLDSVLCIYFNSWYTDLYIE